jgi:hypothetical protein
LLDRSTRKVPRNALPVYVHLKLIWPRVVAAVAVKAVMPFVCSCCRAGRGTIGLVWADIVSATVLGISQLAAAQEPTALTNTSMLRKSRLAMCIP